ncbi:MAG: PilZ domain-containing protein [Thermodesulfobacteriota bacterium]
MATFEEKRKHVRVYFSPDDGVQGVFVFPDFEQVSFAATVLDLSLGGLHFVVKREELNALEVGSRLVLVELDLAGQPIHQAAVPLVVRRIFDHPMVSNVSLGCEFAGSFSPEGRQALQELVASRLDA